MSAISICGLRKTFGSFTALDNVDLEVPEGVCFGILGPNGAGKTTTIKIILGLLEPSEGEVRVFGEMAGSYNVRRRIGYLPERIEYHNHVLCIDFLKYVGILNHMKPLSAERAAREILAWVGLEGWESYPIGTLSAGMKQRLGLAQALMGSPDLLILDEPTTNLDPIGRKEILDKVRELVRDGKTVLISSHILSEVEAVSDYVGIIFRGRVLRQGKLKDVVQELVRSKSGRCELIVDKKDAVLSLLRERGVDVTVDGERIIISSSDMDSVGKMVPKVLAEADARIIKFAPVGGTLQEVFLQLVSEGG
ncbi:MAG: ABC transporter ATP-binding protein [Candidatus Freyarchaeota archaeon]|nr:ABC transporter ATP-binding protein [Candidatus Jordarchaeia archaeon]